MYNFIEGNWIERFCIWEQINLSRIPFLIVITHIICQYKIQFYPVKKPELHPSWNAFTERKTSCNNLNKFNNTRHLSNLHTSLFQFSIKAITYNLFRIARFLSTFFFFLEERKLHGVINGKFHSIKMLQFKSVHY